MTESDEPKATNPDARREDARASDSDGPGEPTRPPMPEYGEYASAEELAAALKRSGAPDRRVEPQTPPAQREPAPVSAPRNSLDRIVTVFLLSFGAVFVIGGAPNYLNLGETLNETMKQFGADGYQPTDQTGLFGIAMLASQILLWLLAAAVSYRRIKRHKTAWWVPVLAGVVSFLVLSVLLGSLLAADPAFVATVSTG